MNNLNHFKLFRGARHFSEIVTRKLNVCHKLNGLSEIHYYTFWKCLYNFPNHFKQKSPARGIPPTVYQVSYSRGYPISGGVPYPWTEVYPIPGRSTPRVWTDKQTENITFAILRMRVVIILRFCPVLMNSSLISYSASRSTIHQGEWLLVVREKLASLERGSATALAAKPCWAVELCQAGLFAATFVPPEIAAIY